MSIYSLLTRTQWDSMKTVVAAYAYWMAKDKIKVNRKEKKKSLEHFWRSKTPFLRVKKCFESSKQDSSNLAFPVSPLLKS